MKNATRALALSVAALLLAGCQLPSPWSPPPPKGEIEGPSDIQCVQAPCP